MKLFWIVPEALYPANTGGRIVVYKRIEYLSRRNEIVLFGICDSDEEKEQNEHYMKNYCRDVHFYNREKYRSSTLVRLYKAPYACVSRWIPDMTSDMDELYGRLQPDYVIVDFPQMYGIIPKSIRNSGNIILEQHNTEFMTMNSLGKSFRHNIIKKVVFLTEAIRMKHYEKALYDRNNEIKLYTFVSREDKRFFEEKYKIKKTYLLPVGCEIAETTKPAMGKNICYFGKMCYPANVEAALWFVENVFSKICEHRKDVYFYIVGKDPVKELTMLPQKYHNVVVTGTVDSVDAYYDKASVVVVPLSHGGGVKVKLLEALGKGKLVITTTKGLEGTDFKDGEHLLTADSAEKYIELCLDVLENPKSYAFIGKQGFVYVKNNYTWEAIMNSFHCYLEEERQKSM